MLEDSDPDVPIAAMHGVSSRRYAGALPVLQKLVLAKDLADKNADGDFERTIIKVTDPDKYRVNVSDYFV